MQDDVWVKRIQAIGENLTKVIIALASIIAAWQSTMANRQSADNAREIQVMRGKQDVQIEAFNRLPPMMGAK